MLLRPRAWSLAPSTKHRCHTGPIHSVLCAFHSRNVSRICASQRTPGSPSDSSSPGSGRPALRNGNNGQFQSRAPRRKPHQQGEQPTDRDGNGGTSSSSSSRQSRAGARSSRRSWQASAPEQRRQQQDQYKQGKTPSRQDPAVANSGRGTSATSTSSPPNHVAAYQTAGGLNVSHQRLCNTFVDWQQLQAWAVHPQVWGQLGPWHAAQLLVATAHLLHRVGGHVRHATADMMATSVTGRQISQESEAEQQQQQGVHFSSPAQQQGPRPEEEDGEQEGAPAPFTDRPQTSTGSSNWRLRWLHPEGYRPALSRFSILQLNPTTAAAAAASRRRGRALFVSSWQQGQSAHNQHAAQDDREEQQQQQQQQVPVTAGAGRVLTAAELESLVSWCSDLLEHAAAQCTGTALDAVACGTLLYWMFQMDLGRSQALQYLQPAMGRRLTAAISGTLVGGLTAADAGVPAAVVVNLVYYGTVLGVPLPWQLPDGRPTAAVVARALEGTACRLVPRCMHHHRYQHHYKQKWWHPGRGSGWSWVEQLLWCEEFWGHNPSTGGLLGSNLAPQLQQDMVAACWALLQVSGPPPRLSWALTLIKRLVSHLPRGVLVTLALPTEGSLGDGMRAADAIANGSSSSSSSSGATAQEQQQEQQQQQQQQEQTGGPSAGQQMAALPACILAVLGVPLEYLQQLASGQTPDQFMGRASTQAAATAATAAAAAAAHSMLHSGEQQVPGTGVIAATGRVARLLPKQVLEQLSKDLETASNLLEWVAAAKCQVPLLLLRELLEGMVPNLRRLSATQLQRCVRAGGVLHQRGQVPPNSFASACLAAADMLPAHEEECIVDIVWTISHWGVPLWWLEDAAGAEGAAAGVAAPQEVPAAGAGGAVSPAAAEDAASAEAPPPPAAAAAYPYGSPRPMSLIARKLVRQLQQQQLTPEAAAEVLIRVSHAMSLAPGPVPAPLLDALGTLGLRLLSKGAVPPSAASRWLCQMTALGWGPSVAPEDKQMMLDGLMDVIRGTQKRRTAHLQPKQQQVLQRSQQQEEDEQQQQQQEQEEEDGGKKQQQQQQQSPWDAAWDCPVVFVHLLTGLAAGGFVHRGCREWWLLTQQLLHQQWHRYSPLDAATVLQALAAARCRLPDSTLRMLLVRVGQGMPQAGVGSTGEAEASTAEGPTPSTNIRNTTRKQLGREQLAAILPALAQLRVQAERLPEGWWACYRLALLAAAPKLKRRSAVGVVYAAVRLGWALDAEVLTAALTRLTRGDGGNVLQLEACSQLCAAMPRLLELQQQWAGAAPITISSSISSSRGGGGGGELKPGVEATASAAGGQGISDSGAPSAAQGLQALLEQLAPQLMQRVCLLLQQGPLETTQLAWLAAGLGALLQAQRAWSSCSSSSTTTTSSSSSVEQCAQAHSSVAAAVHPGAGMNHQQDPLRAEEQVQALQQQPGQQQEDLEESAKVLVPLLLSAAKPAWSSCTASNLLQLLQGLHALGLEQLPAEVADRVQRRIGALQSARLVNSDQLLGLLRALMVLGVLPEPALISLRLDGSRRPETLALVQDLKEALDAQLGSELSPVPPAAASYEAGDTRGAWALSMDEEGGGDLSGGEGSSGLGTGGLQEDDWDAIIDAARAEIEGMNGISSSLLSLEGQGDP